ncbi:efflux RND transporter periplasmic adaptor subunit [Henriciella sp.]|uniref:efflux RND transporter periplasmic adaptor subunit n=1 Tax=Henriciella sp. TaxID=1968823 RepID=UPI0026329250|nr:efflux RND transporter periplasmic adaptor subunit [Henriciella sp.]
MKPFQLISLGLLTIAGLTACQGEESTPEPRQASERAVQIVPHQVQYVTESTRVEAVGTARARSTAAIYPETAGEVVSINFSAGDKVGKNQILLQLEARSERLAVKQAEVSLREAERLIERYDTVSTPGVIAGNEMDRAQAAYDNAQVQLEIAQENLGDRTVRAPFSGYVGLTDIDPGARITTDTEITRLDDREVLFVDFPVPEQTFGRIEAGDTLEVEPFSNPDVSYEAEILTLDSSIDAGTRAYTVRAAIDNSEDRLRPGMSFRIGFELPGQDYPAVPEASIVWGGDGAFLWAIENGRAERVSITIISRDEGMVLVKADIAEGSWIIEEGVQKMRPGIPVETPERTDAVARSDTQASTTGGGPASPALP